MVEAIKAKYVCGTKDFPGCGKYFEKEQPGTAICPYCGHKYLTWTNYKNFIR